MKTTRRGLFALGALSALGWTSGSRGALGGVSLTPHRDGPPGDTLISIFLRGGVDGLSVVVPHGDDDYYRARPTLALARPGDRRGKPTERVLDLDDYFGLHPALAPLWPLHEAGQLAVVHACGSGDTTHSHFEAMATVERGVSQGDGPASGWLARHLETAPWDNPSPLRAVALGSLLPQSLRGENRATALQTTDDLRLRSPFAGGTDHFTRDLSVLYGHSALAEAGGEALSVLKTISALPPLGTHSAYPADDLGAGLRQTARLMKSGVGLEAACFDHNGYDTHVLQGGAQGALASRLASLASGLAAFAADLGSARWARTTVVVLSEFGRRVPENSGLGTDHGSGGVLLLLGGGVAGGRVYGRWPGLAAGSLSGPGDLEVTTDYRAVLAEVIARRLGNPHTSKIFPGLTQPALGVVHG